MTEYALGIDMGTSGVKVAALDAARGRTVDWVRTLSDGQLDLPGRHPALGQITLETMITAIYGHQLLHMRDLAALR